jgi:hypothetical protein
MRPSCRPRMHAARGRLNKSRSNDGILSHPFPHPGRLAPAYAVTRQPNPFSLGSRRLCVRLPPCSWVLPPHAHLGCVVGVALCFAAEAVTVVLSLFSVPQKRGGSGHCLTSRFPPGAIRGWSGSSRRRLAARCLGFLGNLTAPWCDPRVVSIM